MSLASRLLPITKRGQFFEDDFFRDFQPEYSSAVHDVLDKWGGRSMLADHFSNYRQARESQPQDDSTLAASISDTPEQYVIVLDMTDYVSGEITVRNRKLNAVVDAKVGNSKHFSRSFPLPKDTNTETLVAAMSDEGILTITAKRMGTKKVPVATTTEETSTSNTVPEMMSSLKIDTGLTEETTNGSPSTPSAASDCSESTSERRSSTTEAYKTLPISKRGQFFKDDFFKNVWSDFDSAMDEMVMRQKSRKEKREEERMKRDQARDEVIQQMLRDQEEQSRKIREARMERRRKASEDMQQQMNMFQSPMMDRFRSYKTLRNWAGGDESQAQTITSDDKAYKVVLDVKEYADGELDLKSDGEILTVTGSKGALKFKREFSLPGMGAPEEVSASLSEDGVLTITAPKK